MNAPVGSLLVLLVEDDPLVRMSAVDMIELSGHRVRETQTAEAALRELNAADDIDVLVTDIKLPGMSGDDLVLEALQRWPKLKIVVVSGKETEKLATVKDRVVFLSKPFTWEQLVKVIEQ